MIFFSDQFHTKHRSNDAEHKGFRESDVPSGSLIATGRNTRTISCVNTTKPSAHRLYRRTSPHRGRKIKESKNRRVISCQIVTMLVIAHVDVYIRRLKRLY